MTEKIILLTIKVKIEIPENEDIDSDTGSITYTEMTEREIIK